MMSVIVVQCNLFMPLMPSLSTSRLLDRVQLFRASSFVPVHNLVMHSPQIAFFSKTASRLRLQNSLGVLFLIVQATSSVFPLCANAHLSESLHRVRALRLQSPLQRSLYAAW